MLQQLMRAFVDPRGFFRWLSTRPPRLLPAYLVLVVAILLSVPAVVEAFRSMPEDQAHELSRVLANAGISSTLVVWAGLLCLPLLALVDWVLVWIPVRLGAGPAPRLWEVAGWSQLPTWITVLMNGAVVRFYGQSSPLSSFVSLLSLFWCTWFVYAGVRETAGGKALRAAAVYLGLGILAAALGLLIAFLSANRASPILAS